MKKLMVNYPNAFAISMIVVCIAFAMSATIVEVRHVVNVVYPTYSVKVVGLIALAMINFSIVSLFIFSHSYYSYYRFRKTFSRLSDCVVSTTLLAVFAITFLPFNN